MAINVYVTERICKQLPEQKLDQLIAEFELYIEKGKFRPHFGRDYGFEWPASAVEAEMQKIHVHPNFLTGEPVDLKTNKLKSWRLQSKDQHNMASDTWLIYCQGYHDEDNFMFIAFWKDGAHALGNKTSLVGMLADEALEFRKKF